MKTAVSWRQTPHIEVLADQALQVAHQKVLEKLIERSSDDEEKQMLTLELETLRASAS